MKVVGHIKRLWTTLQKKLEKVFVVNKAIEERKEILMTIEDMARAHLETVRKAINDLIGQKEKIDSEVARLKEYVTMGENVIADYKHVNSVDSNREPEIRGF